MKKFLILSLILMIGFSVSAGAETYIVKVGPFEKLKITGNISVVYKNVADSIGLARYEAPEGLNNIFEFENKKEELLKISPGNDDWGKNDLPVIFVYSEFLTSVESYSEKDVNILNPEPSAEFTASLIGNGSLSVEGLKCNNINASLSTGNGSIYLTGSCVTANLKMIGTGLISADQLQSENVNCKILGTGSIGCWPVDNLKVTGLGSTKIYYKGKPNIKKKGGGKLFELPEETKGKTGTELRSLTLPSEDE